MFKADICGHCVRANNKENRNGNIKCDYLGIMRGYNAKACDAGWILPEIEKRCNDQYTAILCRLPTDCEKYNYELKNPIVEEDE